MKNKNLLEKYINKLEYHYYEGFNKKIKEGIFDLEMYDNFIKLLLNIYLYYKGKEQIDKKAVGMIFLIQINYLNFTHKYNKYEDDYYIFCEFFNNFLVDDIDIFYSMEESKLYEEKISFHRNKGFGIKLCDDYLIFDKKLNKDFISSMNKFYIYNKDNITISKRVFMDLYDIYILFHDFSYFKRYVEYRGYNEKNIIESYKEFRKLYFQILGLSEKNIPDFPILD